jgi:hypothetical protein
MNETVSKLFEMVKATAAAAGDMAGEAAQAAKTKMGELYTGARLTIEIADLHAERDKIFHELGALVFQAHTTSEQPEGVEEKLTKLDGIHEKLRELRLRQEALKSVVRCEKCGAAVHKNDSFCRFCGAELPHPPEEEAPAEPEEEPGIEIEIEIAPDSDFDGEDT